MTKAYRPNIMLDSGAFSAWYHEQPIDIRDYIAFVKEHGERFYSIVCLDKIPGTKGVMAKSPAMIEAAAKESHKNYETMRKAGIESIPVFHHGEDFKWLERMLDDRVPYIGLSPYLKAKTADIINWLDQCFTRLTDLEGRPLCKTHGFGVTGHEIVRRYPWFSIDSTSWALSAGYGNVLMPRMLGRTIDTADFIHPVQFNISERDTAGNNSMMHAGKHARKLIDEYFESLGTSFTEVRNFQVARLVINASYYLGLERQMTQKPFGYRKRGAMARSYAHAAAPFNYKPRIILATMMKIQQQGVVLTDLRAPNRLISYFDARRKSADQIEEYTTNGFVARGAFAYRRGTKSHALRRSMLFLKRLETQRGMEDE
jgi:hypothetical protein